MDTTIAFLQFFKDYCVIRDLSKLIFHTDPEKDLLKWKQISKTDLNNAARELFLQNTDQLNGMGKGVKSLIN